MKNISYSLYYISYSYSLYLENYYSFSFSYLIVKNHI